MEAALPTAAQLYEESVKPLPPSERYKLATLILNDIHPNAIVDCSDEWTDEDLREFTNQSIRRFYEENPVDDDIV